MATLDELRLLIPDTDPASQLFADDDLTLFLGLAGGGVFLAAAMALETIASDEALVYKIVTTDDLSINGVTGAVQVLLARAKTLRADQVKLDSALDESFLLVFPETNDCYPRPEASARWGW